MINKTLAIKKTKQHYTLVEILVVIALMAILMGIGSAGLNGITTKRGVRGGVSMISSQVSLARSVAVAKNHYVALLLPAPDAEQNPENSTSKLKEKFFKSMRLCYVTSDFVFLNWVDDHYWVDLPSKVCANFVNGADKADTSNPQEKYEVAIIRDVPDDPDNINSKDNCFGIVFHPSGSLVGGGKVLVQVYPGLTKPNGSLEMLGLGDSAWRKQDKGNLKYRRWCLDINRFTGRSRISYAQVKK